MDAIGWDKIIALPAALIVLLAFLGFFLRVLPYWKEVKLAEIKVRETEANSRTDEATIFGKLSDALNSMGGIIERVVIEQQREVKNAHILQRVNADASDKILNRLDTLDEMAQNLETNGKRLGSVETDLLIIKENLKLQEQPKENVPTNEKL